MMHRNIKMNRRLNMNAFVTDVSALPATTRSAFSGRSFLSTFLLNLRATRAPASATARIAASPASVPNLASSTAYMAWLS
jgi:hypothetical protein